MQGSNFIDGTWSSGSAGEVCVTNPATEGQVGAYGLSSVREANEAVSAARRAWGTWSQTTPSERAQALRALAEGLDARRAELIATATREIGTPLGLSAALQVGLPITTLRLTADLVETFVFEEEIGNSLIMREPAGIVVAIAPWNYPLHQTVAKVAPALAAGCAVVVKPSEVAPTLPYALAEVAEETGLPPGVLNFVSGTGPVVGEALAQHPDVDVVSFTGSTSAGKRVAHLATSHVARVALELGGKSASVVLDDADVPRAVEAGVQHAFLNAGQTCGSFTRLIVPRSRLAEVEELAVACANRFVVGDPADPSVTLGPLISAGQRDRVGAYIDCGVAEGAELLCGGNVRPSHLGRGYFLPATIFTSVDPGMRIAQEEIFGPVLSIIPATDEAEAIAVANGTPYGLAAAVWSGDPARANRVARLLRAGQVEVNGGAFNPLAPFGGYKQSGIGRELGRFGLEEYLELKSLQR